MRKNGCTENCLRGIAWAGARGQGHGASLRKHYRPPDWDPALRANLDGRGLVYHFMVIMVSGENCFCRSSSRCPSPERDWRPKQASCRSSSAKAIAVSSKHPGAPPPWHATTFPTPPPFSQRTVMPWDPALPSVPDDPGHSASPTAGVSVPHVPPSLQRQTMVTPALYPPRTSESPAFHTSFAAGRVLPNIVYYPTYSPSPFIVQPRDGALT